MLRGQVQLDMQMMAKLQELKHEQDKLANATKERDRALVILKQREDMVQKLEASIPMYEAERDAVQKEVIFFGTLAIAVATWSSFKAAVPLDNHVCWNPLQLDATIPVLQSWEEKLVLVKNEIKVAMKLLKKTDDKAKELIRTVKENTKKV